MRDWIERTRPSVGKVSVKTPTGWQQEGTCFAITSEGHLATCYHVLSDWQEREVELPSGGRYAASVVKQHQASDLSVIQIAAHTRAAVLGDYEQLNVADDVFWMGYSIHSWVLNAHRGMVGYLGQVPTGTRRIEGMQLDGTVNRGYSGGPIVDSRDGAVVGIVTASLGDIDSDLEEANRAALAARGMVSQVVGDLELDPADMLVKLVEDMRRLIQLGVGFGISVEYLKRLMDEAL